MHGPRNMSSGVDFSEATHNHMQKQDSAAGTGPGPRGAIAIVAETFRLYGRNLVPFLATAAVVTLPLVAAGWAAFGPNFMALMFNVPGGPSADIDATTMAGIAAYSVLYALGLLAVTAAIAESGARVLTGSSLSVGRAYGTAIRRLPHMLGVSIIIAIAIGVPVSVLAILAAETGGMFGSALLATAVGLGTYFTVRLMFAVFIALIEGAGALTAISRSWTLVSRAWLATFGKLVVVSLAVAIVEIALQSVGSAIPGLDTVVLALVVTPLTVIGNLLIYLDLRSRKESLTSDRLMAELEQLPS